MIELFVIILTGTIVLYILQTILVFIGTLRLKYRQIRRLPKVSILVALRNEERTVNACVESLLNLDYPRELFEIILINDRSRDQTPHIIEGFKKRSPLLQTLHIRHAIPGLSGKANAIAQGMELATGDLILVTDGDCRVPPGWAKAHAAYYENDVGLVGGFTLLDEKQDRTPLFGKIQSLDWAYLLSIGSGAIGLGKPLSVLGNNFSFRRQAYETVGGYRNMEFTIIEDFALMKTLLQKTPWRALYPIDPGMVVYSRPMPNLKKFYHQRKRWSAGGKEVGLYGKFLMALSMTVHLLLPVSIFILPPLYPIAGLALILIADFLLLWRTTGLVNRRDLLKYFPCWEIFYFFYTIFFAPVLLFPTTVIWKDTSYSWKFNWKMKRMEEKVR
jgi:cellulose synthase/poly-beta-1,6-N-acetylglucosamine synthase-like glycosyltransferase